MDADDAFVSNISRKTDVDTNGYLDVIAYKLLIMGNI